MKKKREKCRNSGRLKVLFSEGKGEGKLDLNEWCLNEKSKK